MCAQKLTHSLREDETSNWFDPAAREAAALTAHLQSDTSSSSETGKVSVEDALFGEPILQRGVARSQSRVLFVTTDPSVFTASSAARHHYLQLAAYFDEVHIMVLASRLGGAVDTRIADNVWAYKVTATYWWRFPKAVRTFAEEHLVFNGSFRPDLVVALDALRAGFAAVHLARYFKRALQLHLLQATFIPSKIGRPPLTWSQQMLAGWVFSRADSVRVTSPAQKSVLMKRDSTKPIELLPHYYNFAAFTNGPSAFDLHERYPEYTFFAVTKHILTADSSLHDVLSALRPMLLANAIALVVIGDGPARALFEEKVRLLGIADKVLFVGIQNDLTSYFKSADVLIETGVEKENDETVLQAIAAQLPILCYQTELRLDMLEHKRSALICEVSDIHSLGQYFSKYINTPALRLQCRRNLTHIAADRLNEDSGAYFQSYRDSIEVAISEEAAGQVKATKKGQKVAKVMAAYSS